jgi:hypothetical protein
LGGRALSFFFKKIGCSGGLTLALVFGFRALLASDSTPPLGNLMLPGGDSGAGSSNDGRSDPMSVSYGRSMSVEGDPQSESEDSNRTPIHDEASSSKLRRELEDSLINQLTSLLFVDIH